MRKATKISNNDNFDYHFWGVPVLDICGHGLELQKPIALSVIGGMCLGLFISLSFIPLIYWFGSNKRKNNI